MKKIIRYLLLSILQVSFLQAFSQDFWEVITTEPDSVCARCMYIGSEGDIYIGMWGFSYPGGIYRSTDNAQTWEYLGLTEKPIYEIEVCTNGDIIAGIYSGIFKSNDNGNTWYQTYWPAGNITTLLSLANGYVFAGGVDNLHGIIRSMDFGDTWDTVHVFTNYGEENLEALTVSGEGHIWAGTHNIYGQGSISFTTDLGETWTEFDSPCNYTQVYSLAFHPQGDLFAGFHSEGLYRYNFTNQQWTALYYPWVSPDDILFIGDYKIFVGLGPDGYDGVIYSEDGGQSFTTLNSGINGGNGGSISYVLRHPNKLIYILGYDFYRSFEPIFTGDRENNFVMTYISQNFPNPFNNNTTIHWNYSNDKDNAVIIITSASGEIILKEKIRNTGNYLFHADNFDPGIYYYTIIGKINIYSGKMVLIR